jgi:hypothetical protein
MTGRRRLRRIAAVAGASTMLALAGCSSGGGANATASAPAQARPSSTAKLSIESPTDGQKVPGSSVDLKVSLEGARIVQTTSTKLTPDQGHLHVALDGNIVSMTFGLDQEIPGITPGQHVLRVEFVATDHGPFDPRVFASVVFEATT